MVDLDEGERLFREWAETDDECNHLHTTTRWIDWAYDNAPALIAELRAARETIKQLHERLDLEP